MGGNGSSPGRGVWDCISCPPEDAPGRGSGCQRASGRGDAAGSGLSCGRIERRSAEQADTKTRPGRGAERSGRRCVRRVRGPRPRAVATGHKRAWRFPCHPPFRLKRPLPCDHREGLRRRQRPPLIPTPRTASRADHASTCRGTRPSRKDNLSSCGRPILESPCCRDWRTLPFAWHRDPRRHVSPLKKSNPSSTRCFVVSQRQNVVASGLTDVRFGNSHGGPSRAAPAHVATAKSAS